METFELSKFLSDFVKFATFGVTTEVVFTAIDDLIKAKRKGEPISWRLMGYSYIWMLPIYGSIAFFAPLLFPLLAGYPLIIRLMIYGVIILAVEYVTGMALKLAIGRCPWHYESKFAIHNVIRLDYYPLWMFFAWVVESLYYF